MVRREECIRNLKRCAGTSNVINVLGIHGCGLTSLLNEEYRRLLLEKGVREDQIIYVDISKEEKWKEPSNLRTYLCGLKDSLKSPAYIFIDGICGAGKGAARRLHKDLYETIMLLAHKDSIKQYLICYDRSSLHEMPEKLRRISVTIPIYPLSFREYFSSAGGNIKQAFSDYTNFGGLPGILSCRSEEDKKRYLLEVLGTNAKALTDKKDSSVSPLSQRVLLEMAQAVGTYTTAGQIAQRLEETVPKASQCSIRELVTRITDRMLFDKVQRYDLSRDKYLSSPQKFFCADTGLLNAVTNFASPPHAGLMENVIYNELKQRGLKTAMAAACFWETGADGARKRIHVDMGFLVKGKHSSVHVLYMGKIDSREEYYKKGKELSRLKNSYPIIIVRGDMEPGKGWLDENCIMNISIIDFLMDRDIIL